jgi:hypothetical protein
MSPEVEAVTFFSRLLIPFNSAAGVSVIRTGSGHLTEEALFPPKIIFGTSSLSTALPTRCASMA